MKLILERKKKVWTLKFANCFYERNFKKLRIDNINNKKIKKREKEDKLKQIRKFYKEGNHPD
jgi:hypothetical protein